jgi:hypothetical protein
VLDKVGLSSEDIGFYQISYPVTNEFGTYHIEWYIDVYAIGSTIPLEDIATLESLEFLSFTFIYHMKDEGNCKEMI